MSRFGAFLIFVALVVVGIIAFQILKPFQDVYRKHDKQRISDLYTISQALETYHANYGKYPDYAEGSYIIKVDDTIFPWGTSWNPYLDLLPLDPGINKKYAYWSDRDKNFNSYKLYASLDEPHTYPNSCGGTCADLPATNMCGKYAVCNYEVRNGIIIP